MQTSEEWIAWFRQNAGEQRIDWSIQPVITPEEKKAVLHSLQAWQLGETSDGRHLMAAAHRYSAATDDKAYPQAVLLFIKEEQKHGNNLGRYLDRIGEARITRNWGDTLFRKIRYWNTSMEWWTLAVITVESTAQVYYQCLKDATNCALLRQICTDILIDEAYHIDFQLQRMQMIYAAHNRVARNWRFYFYQVFYYGTIMVVWLAHRRVFAAGGVGFKKYLRKMHAKFRKTIQRIPAKAYRDLAAEELMTIKPVL